MPTPAVIHSAVYMGKCHLCGNERAIRWCGRCKHWFCAECRSKWWDRGFAALKQKLFGARVPGCCGPRDLMHA